MYYVQKCIIRILILNSNQQTLQCVISKFLLDIVSVSPNL